MLRTVLSTTAFILVAFALGHPLCAETRPNIVIILADDLGYSDIGCYGSEIATPNLDRLANNGLRYTNFYNCGRCWPTRAALLTGYYAQQTRRDQVPGVKSGVSGERPAWAPLLPALLHPLGYRCYHAGKWHIDGLRIFAGFDHSYSVEDHDRYFGPNRILIEDKMATPPQRDDSRGYVTASIADDAIAALKEHALNHVDTPFFHYICFTAPHFPLQALPDDIARYRDRYRIGWDGIRNQRFERQRQLGLVTCDLSPTEPEVGPPYHFSEVLQKLGPNEVNRPVPWDTLTASQQEFQANKMAIHAAMIDRMDQEIGRILAQLESMNALSNTLLCFLSDNGASAEMMVRGDGHQQDSSPGSAESFLCLGPGWSSVSNTPFRRHKTWVHEGGIATPLIVHWPDRIAARGELRNSVGHVIDIVPTLLDILRSVPNPTASQPQFPGTSLLATFDADNAESHRTLWWLHEGNRAILEGHWKLVAANGTPWELYDLSQDRSETRNLASGEPERTASMSKAWEAEFERISSDARRDLQEGSPAP